MKLNQKAVAVMDFLRSDGFETFFHMNSKDDLWKGSAWTRMLMFHDDAPLCWLNIMDHQRIYIYVYVYIHTYLYVYI